MNEAALLALVRGAEAAADVAGAVIRPFFRAGITSDLKSDASPVTIADRTAEQAMRAVLSERFPGHGILGEEFGLQNPGAELRWVLDPIDGTRAFITGRPSFGTLIALLDGDTPILGIIDQPVTGERWIGAKGLPTRFHGPFGGTPITRSCPAIAQAELGATTPDMFQGADAAKWSRLTRAAGRTYYGGDCYTYGLVALGQVDISVDATMKIWDWAALVPIVEGAGGRVTDWQGRPMHPDGDGRTLAVGDPALLAQVLDILAS
jgi:histidinol phosphatase-like enzyme (inositol monophosphatase family)